MQKKTLLFVSALMIVSYPGQAFYDDYGYNSFSSNQFQYQNQYQNNNFSPKLDSLKFNYKDDFVKNSAYKPIVEGYRKEGNLKSFLQEKVAPNLDLKSYSGSRIENNGIHSAFSVSDGSFHTQQYQNVEYNQRQQVIKFDNFTDRNDWTIQEQISQIDYNDQNLVTAMEVATVDVAGNQATQRLINITYQPNTDQGRFNDLLNMAQNKAAMPDTYGFDNLVKAMEGLPEPPKALAAGFEMKVIQANGQEASLNVTNMQWKKERLIGFEAEAINPQGIDIVSVEIKVNDTGQVDKINLEVNGVARQIELGADQSLEEATNGMMKGLNPIALLSGTDTQIGDGKVVYLAKNYNDHGQLDGGDQEHKINYGKKKLFTPKANQLKAAIKQLEQTAPTITKNIVWDQNIAKTKAKQLTKVKQAITDTIQQQLKGMQKQTSFKTAQGQTIKRLDKEPFKIEGNKIINQGQFETEQGQLKQGMSFQLKNNKLTAIDSTTKVKENQSVQAKQARQEKAGINPKTKHLMKQMLYHPDKEKEVKEITVALIKSKPQSKGDKAKSDAKYQNSKVALQTVFNRVKDMPNARKESYSKNYKVLEQSLKTDWQDISFRSNQKQQVYDMPGEEGKIKLTLENKQPTTFEHVIKNEGRDQATGHIKLKDGQFNQEAGRHKFIVSSDNRPLAMIPAKGIDVEPEVKALLQDKGIMIMTSPDDMGKLINQNAIVPILNGVGNRERSNAPDYTKIYARKLNDLGIENAFTVPLYTRGKLFETLTTGLPKGVKEGLQKVVKDSLLTNGLEMISSYSVQRDKITKHTIKQLDKVKNPGTSKFILEVAYSGGAQPGAELGIYFNNKVSMINVDGPMAEADISRLHSYTRLRASLIGDMYAVDHYPENSQIINLSDPKDGQINMDLASHNVFENEVTRGFITKTIVRQLETHFNVMTDDLEYIKR